MSAGESSALPAGPTREHVQAWVEHIEGLTPLLRDLQKLGERVAIIDLNVFLEREESLLATFRGLLEGHHE